MNSRVSKLDGELARAIGASVEQAVGDPETQIHSLLLPDIKNTYQAVAAIGELVDNTKFWLERNEVAEGFLRLNVRYPVNESNVQA